MKNPKEIEGTQNTCLHLKTNPIIIQPSRRLESPSNGVQSSKYIFREVNFISEDLDSLFVLQNRNDDIWLIFEDCHFLFEG